ncbi:hypothetical protein D3C80_1339420 [compost metagenome]
MPADAAERSETLKKPLGGIVADQNAANAKTSAYGTVKLAGNTDVTIGLQSAATGVSKDNLIVPEATSKMICIKNRKITTGTFNSANFPIRITPA